MKVLEVNKLVKYDKNRSDFQKIEDFLFHRSRQKKQQIFQGSSGLSKFKKFMNTSNNM